MKKSNIKVLALESWMKIFQGKNPSLTKMTPVFGRDGYYMSGESMCWFEVNGKAYLYDKKAFKYKLLLLNHRYLRQSEYEAIEYLIKSKLADIKLKRLYWMENEFRYARKAHYFRRALKNKAINK